MSNRAAAGSGGGGAGYHAKIIITEGGYYDVVVGSGGGSRGARGNNSATDTTAGAASKFSVKDGETLISAGGGGRGTSNQSSATAGAGGTLTKSANLKELEVFVSRNGYNGSSTNGAGSVSGAAGPISGHTWGASAEASGSYNSGSTGYSRHGYFYIKYVGEAPDMFTFTINPTPSDATVTLTVDGASYTQSSITVVSGTTVGWSVSKSGYTTQTGTNTITEDTTENVTLVVNPVLYYCYRADFFGSWLYYYTQNEYVTIPDGVTVTVYWKDNGYSQATSSSQLNDSFVASGLTAPVRYSAGDLYT